MRHHQITTLSGLARDRARCDTWCVAALLTLLLVSVLQQVTPGSFHPLARILLIAIPTLTIVALTTRTSVEAVVAIRTHDPAGKEFAASTFRTCGMFALMTFATLAIATGLPSETASWALVLAAAAATGLLLTVDLFWKRAVHAAPVRDQPVLTPTDPTSHTTGHPNAR